MDRLLMLNVTKEHTLHVLTAKACVSESAYDKDGFTYISSGVRSSSLSKGLSMGVSISTRAVSGRTGKTG